MTDTLLANISLHSLKPIKTNMTEDIPKIATEEKSKTHNSPIWFH